jgi:hypothetical protein
MSPISRKAARALAIASVLLAAACGGSAGTDDGEASLDPSESALTGGWTAIGGSTSYATTPTSRADLSSLP